MTYNVLAATPATVDTLKKAYHLVNKQIQTSEESQNNTKPAQTNIHSDNIVPVRVISGDGVNGYTCDIFENGLDKQATKRGIVYLANGNSTIYTLPAGTILYAQQINIATMGTGN